MKITVVTKDISIYTGLKLAGLACSILDTDTELANAKLNSSADAVVVVKESGEIDVAIQGSRI